MPLRAVKDIPSNPIVPPQPFIANLATAKNTDKIARELKFIAWMLFVIVIGIGIMLFCEIEMAVRLSSILSFNAVS